MKRGKIKIAVYRCYGCDTNPDKCCELAFPDEDKWIPDQCILSDNGEAEWVKE